MIRLVFGVFPTEMIRGEMPLLDIIGILGATGIVWGSVMAIPQRNLKRMLAYSSVAQIGYIALGIGLGTAFGLIGAVLHILNHACMKACLFLVASNLEAKGKGIDIQNLNASLRRDMPWTSAAFAVAAISMIGLPPTAGFFSKWYLLLGSFEESRFVFVGVILLSSLLNAVYFFRILERIYLGKAEPTREEPTAGQPSSFSLVFSPLVLGTGLLVLGLGNALIVTYVLNPMLPIAP
jgi:multicomponent Na+:H+ antiporter subunit D